MSAERTPALPVAFLHLLVLAAFGFAQPLLDLLVETVPPPSYDEGHPLQARVTNLDADS